MSVIRDHIWKSYMIGDRDNDSNQFKGEKVWLITEDSGWHLLMWFSVCN
jgi:hypothetical protein